MSEKGQHPSDEQERTLALFNLIFFYAMAQVTILMLAGISWVGFGHGLLGLAAVCWAWVCYSWLTTTSAHAGAASSSAELVPGSPRPWRAPIVGGVSADRAR